MEAPRHKAWGAFLWCARLFTKFPCCAMISKQWRGLDAGTLQARFREEGSMIWNDLHDDSKVLGIRIRSDWDERSGEVILRLSLPRMGDGA